ncbi:MAG TPA: radical SAM/SPASM domain-containing protein [Bacteroidales bacterium]|nr:radical SAM/SPASM domain-containing protein [Bacteroidales bacterium]
MIAPFINAIYSIFTYGLVRGTGLYIEPPVPPAVNIELSTHCNLSCPECVTGSGTLTRRKGFMDPALADKLASEISGNVLSAYLYFQGEPMMHPRFFEIVSLYRNMNPGISTNGHFLDDRNCEKLIGSGLKKIIISYDGVTPETYSKYRRGGDQATVKEGIERLAAKVKLLRSPLVVELQFLLGRHNEHEVNEAARFARSIGARFRVKSMQVLDPGRAENWMPVKDNRGRYEIQGGEVRAAHTPEKGCLRMWATAVVTIEGDVVPCCFDKNASHAMGNIKDHTFRDIWHGEKYRAFRKSVLKRRSSVVICKECPQGTRLRFRS